MSHSCQLTHYDVNFDKAHEASPSQLVDYFLIVLVVDYCYDDDHLMILMSSLFHLMMLNLLNSSYDHFDPKGKQIDINFNFIISISDIPVTH